MIPTETEWIRIGNKLARITVADKHYLCEYINNSDDFGLYMISRDFCSLYPITSSYFSHILVDIDSGNNLFLWIKNVKEEK